MPASSPAMSKPIVLLGRARASDPAPSRARGFSNGLVKRSRAPSVSVPSSYSRSAQAAFVLQAPWDSHNGGQGRCPSPRPLHRPVRRKRFVEVPARAIFGLQPGHLGFQPGHHYGDPPMRTSGPEAAWLSQNAGEARPLHVRAPLAVGGQSANLQGFHGRAPLASLELFQKPPDLQGKS